MGPVSFAAELSSLSSMMIWVRGCLSKAKLSATTSRKVELALEEALVNIIRYAYASGEGSLDIACQFNDHKAIEFILTDQGIPFDPLKNVPPVDVTENIDDRQLGGLGIYFIHEIMDEMNYLRKNDQNILMLSKRLA